LKTLKQLFLILLALTLLLTGCAPGADNSPAEPDDSSDAPVDDSGDTGEEAPDKEVFVPSATDHLFTLRYDPEKSLNPFTGANADNMVIAGLMYEGLFSVDSKFEATPLLCDEFETENGKNYIITLREDLVFSDGTPLTAADVVYSITRARNGGRFMSRLSIVVSTVALSDTRVSITLSKPNYDLPALLDVPIVKDGTAYDAIPVGTGPYYLTDTANGGKVLYKVPGYRFRNLVNLSSIHLRTVGENDAVDMFSDKRIDLLRCGGSGDPDYIIHVENNTYVYDTSSLTYIGFNAKDTVMSNAGIRRAISYVVDREYICQEIFGGDVRPAPLILSSVLDYYDEAWEEGAGYSIQKLSEIFATIGMNDYSGNGYLDYPIGDDWRVFEVIIIVNKESEERVQVAESVADSLRKVGLNAVVQVLPWAAYMSALQTGEFDIYIGEALLQPDFDVSAFFSSKGSLNYGKSSADYSTVINEFLAAATPEEKAEKAKNLCTFVFNDAAIIPVAFRKYSIITHQDAVQGLDPSQSNVFRNPASLTFNP